MGGPPPKPAGQRQRRNRTTTAARFETDERPIDEAPELGVHPIDGELWHHRTVEFWAEVWDSPMADEFLRADVDGLLALAALVDAFWKGNYGLAAEIRLQRQCFGLTPIDRRRLQWEVVRTERALKQAAPPKPPKRDESGADPRASLRAV